MALVYYDIFAFLLLFAVGTLIEDKKRAVFTLLPLSLFLIVISAYFFFTYHLDFEQAIIDKTIFSAPHTMEAYEKREAAASVGKPYGLYVGFFFIIWIKYYSFSFLISRGARFAYFKLCRKVSRRFQREDS